MSRTKAIMGSMAAHKWVVLTVAGFLVSLQATAVVAGDPFTSTSQVTQGGSISTSEQPDGRTRLTIKASSKPKFTTWKMERPSRVVVDISGGAVSGADAPFDAGTFAVGNVSTTSSPQEGKTRVTMTLRRGADYQVQALGNNIVVDVTPWEVPPKIVAAADPALLDAARKEAAEAARARVEAEARASKAEENARSVVSEERKLGEQNRRQVAEQSARAVAEERQNAARVVAQERQQAARIVADERQRVEQARREAAEQMRVTAADALSKLDAQRTALEASRAKTDAARLEAERMAADLATERVALARARKGVQEAQKAAITAQQTAAEGQRRDEQIAADRAAKHLAKEQLALEQRRTQAETVEKAAAQAMERLAVQKQDVESRQQQAERARSSALDAAKMLESDRQKAALARLEAERLRTTAELAERKARNLLGQAELAQKQAEIHQQQGRKDDAEASRLVSLARQQTEQARATAQAAQVDVARMESERKQLASEREALGRQQAALAESEKQAALVAKRANEVTAKAADVQSAMARLEQEKQALAAQKKALAEQQAELAQRSKANAAERVELDTKASSFEQAMKAQQVALAKAASSQDREQARLKLAENELTSTKAELAKREQALAEVSANQAAQGKHAANDQATLTAAKTALQKAVAAHLEAEQRRANQEEKLLALAAERQSLEANRATMERELVGLKSELATAKAEVARLKLTPKFQAAPVEAVAEVKASAKAAPVPAAPASVPAIPVRKAPPVVAALPQENRVVSAAQTRQHSVTLRVPSRVSRIDFVDEPSRSSVIIELEEPTDFTIERSTGRRVTLRLHHADLPKLLERSMDATQYFGPVRVINSYRDPAERGAVRVEVELAEMVPNRVRTDGSLLYWDFDKSRPGSAATVLPGVFELPPVTVAGFMTMGLPMLVAQSQDATAAAPSRRPGNAKKRFNGRRIDLDFKGADIHNILRLLAEVGGVNIVTSDDVKGEVTIKMRDVPWDQALDVVLRAKVLGQVREGNLIRVAPIQVLEKELEQEISKQKQLTEVMPTETRLIGVSYAEAKDLEARTKDLLSGRGKVSVDERTNNLIVSDVAKNLALVEELVRNLDTQTAQVVIEARIIEARSTFTRALGVQWGGSSFLDPEHGNPTGLVFPNRIGVGGGADDANGGSAQGLVPRPANGVPASQSPNYAVNLPAAVGAGSGGALGLTLGSLAGAFNLNVRLSALEQSGQVRILSSPRISTMDNVQASIEQGVAIPISVISAQGVQTVFVDAKLNLTVKPHVTNEGTVIMNVHVTRNEPDFVNTGARGDPTILKKEAKTVMLVRDGDTAVIGGIYQRNSGLNNAKVPFFADIPIVGFFFRNRKENDDRTEFLVFITPRIANRSRSLAQ